MVDHKIHARGRGRRNALTNQPNDGRSNGGGLRVGEMEKDSFNSHGVPYVINERMMISSDVHNIKVCPNCNNQFNIKKEMQYVIVLQRISRYRMQQICCSWSYKVCVLMLK